MAGALLQGQHRRQALARGPQAVAAAHGSLVLDEDDREAAPDALGMVVGPDLERQDGLGAARAEDVAGLAVNQQDVGAVLGDVAEALAGQLETLVPGVAQLVARGLGEGIADVPEALDEVVSLVVAGQREEDLALSLAHQRRHFL